jgi:hypothetical protein
LGCLSKESDQVRGSDKLFVTNLFFMVKPNISLKGLWKTMKNPNNWCPGRDSKQAPLKYRRITTGAILLGWHSLMDQNIKKNFKSSKLREYKKNFMHMETICSKNFQRT